MIGITYLVQMLAGFGAGGFWLLIAWSIQRRAPGLPIVIQAAALATCLFVFFAQFRIRERIG